MPLWNRKPTAGPGVWLQAEQGWGPLASTEPKEAAEGAARSLPAGLGLLTPALQTSSSGTLSRFASVFSGCSTHRAGARNLHP